MVNKYKRKTEQASWSENTMQLAMDEAKKTSVSAAAKKYGITLSTLQRHLKKGSCEKKLGRYKRVFNDAQEKELLEYIFHVDDLFYGLTKIEFLELVYQYAEKNNITHPFKDGRAGNDWYLGFKSRHPELTIRRPEPTSIARARGFNKPQVERFFDLLEREIDKHAIDATRIYNVDETGIQTTSNKPPKILTRTGKKQVGVISSVERGKLTTVVCCCNAAGSFTPPFLIFGRKRMVGRLLDGAPPGASATCTDNGWINGPTFLEWLRHFVHITRPTPERKVILIMDNHESHKYLGALEYASQNNVIFVSLPPHTTHRMQPLDRCVYGPLKTYFEQAVSVFQRSHVGRIISQYEVARLFGDAYMRAASAQNAISGFTSTGIWPTNRHIFDESDFLPSTLTDRPEPPTSEDVENAAARNNESQSAPIPQTENSSKVENDPMPTENQLACDNSELKTIEDGDSLLGKEITTEIDRCSTPVNLITLQPVSVPSTPLIPVKPIDIRPTPKLSPNKKNRKRKIQRAEVLTSTPIKEQQREKEEKKKRVETKSNKKKWNLKDSVFANKKLNAAEKKKRIEQIPSTSGSRTKKIIDKKQQKETKKQYVCIICGDLYQEPPQEDWIQCGDCGEWAHENCTQYSGVGSYFCDLCH